MPAKPQTPEVDDNPTTLRSFAPLQDGSERSTATQNCWYNSMDMDPNTCPPQSGDGKRSKIVACAVIIEELRSRLPADVDCEIMDFGLHRSPEQLRTKLQETIDKSSDYETIVLAFGLCGMSVVGLSSHSSTLVVPRADDCIAVFLGSRAAYLKQQTEFPGTLFLSKGWIEGRIDNTSPGTEVFRQLLAKYGEERALRMYSIYQARQPLRHYKRLAFITTSAESELDKYKDVARRRAADLKLSYEEILGSTAFMDKIATAAWDKEFVVTPPGHRIGYNDFLG